MLSYILTPARKRTLPAAGFSLHGGAFVALVDVLHNEVRIDAPNAGRSVRFYSFEALPGGRLLPDLFADGRHTTGFEWEWLGLDGERIGTRGFEAVIDLFDVPQVAAAAVSAHQAPPQA